MQIAKYFSHIVYIVTWQCRSICLMFLLFYLSGWQNSSIYFPLVSEVYRVFSLEEGFGVQMGTVSQKYAMSLQSYYPNPCTSFLSRHLHSPVPVTLTFRIVILVLAVHGSAGAHRLGHLVVLLLA